MRILFVIVINLCIHFEISLGLSLPILKSYSRLKLKAATNAVESISNTFEDYDFDSDEILSRTIVNGRGRLVPQVLSVERKSSMLSLLVYTKGSLNILKNLFLPIGYPKTTPAEYSEFQMWNLIQDASSFLRGIMSTQAILAGMGVGRSDITSLQATIQWIFRDGASMIGGLAFTFLASGNFGQNVKSWRLFADFINNLGITLDIIAPLFPKHFLSIVCIASVFKALCGVAAGATGVIIAEHWGSKNGNIGDVLAKNGAQHTALNLLGLAVSVKFARFANASSKRMWSTYIILTAFHMLSNVKAMRILALRSINIVRYNIIISRLLNSNSMKEYFESFLSKSENKNAQNLETISLQHVTTWMDTTEELSPSSIAKSEPIISLILPNPLKYISQLMKNDFLLNKQMTSRINDNVSIWTTPSDLSAIFTSDEIHKSMKCYENLNYFILSSPNKSHVYVCFKRGCSLIDQAEGTLEGLVYEKVRDIRIARVITGKIFPTFLETLKKNDWDLTRIQLRPRLARISSMGIYVGPPS